MEHNCSQIGHLGLFCSEFLSVYGTHCSQTGHLGLFCSEFLSVNGTHCSQIGHLGLFCSEFPSVRKWNTLFPNWSFTTVLFRVPICEWNTLFPNWSFRTVLFRVPICKWNTRFPNSELLIWHSYFVSTSRCLFLNETNNKARTDLLGQAWLHLSVMNFAQW